MTDLAARVSAARGRLKPRADATLTVTLPAARAALDPAYAAELEREHAYYRTGRTRSLKRETGPSIDEQARCEECYRFVAHRHADCLACGHRPDLHIGHRQTKRTKAQQKQARDARARRKRQR